MFNKFFALAMTGLVTASGTAVLSALSIVSTPLTASANAQDQHRQYKVTFWYTIDEANDGPLDNVLELYGTLKVDGGTRPEMRHEIVTPVSREANQNLDLKTIYVRKPSITVNAVLNDRDTATADDAVFRMDNFTLDLTQFAGGEKTVRYRSGRGEGATLHMQVSAVR